ncbi:MAG: CvpA family protein [Treponema sp.]|nr:CvpA family protein [Treponema sp.]
MNNASILDLVFLAIIALFAVVGLVRGFIRELFARGAPVLALWAAMLAFRKVNEYVEPHVQIHILSVIISFLLVFIAVYIVLMIVRNIISGVFGGEIFKGLDRLLGFAFGIVEGLAVVALLLIILQAQPWFDVQSLLDESFFYKMLGWVGSLSGSVQNVPVPEETVAGDAA